MTYEPYLSTVRAAPDKGKIIATTLDYPMIMDTFGCTPKFLTENPKAAKALADSYFEAVDADRQGSGQVLRGDGRRREAVRRSSSATRRNICAGRTRPPTRSSSPANCRPSTRKPQNCCSKSASSSRFRRSTISLTRASSSSCSATHRSPLPILEAGLPISSALRTSRDTSSGSRDLEAARGLWPCVLRPVRCRCGPGQPLAATSRKRFSPTR